MVWWLSSVVERLHGMDGTVAVRPSTDTRAMSSPQEKKQRQRTDLATLHEDGGLAGVGVLGGVRHHHHGEVHVQALHRVVEGQLRQHLVGLFVCVCFGVGG